MTMKNLLLSAAIGDIAGMPYEFGGRTKNYDAVDLVNPQNDYPDDTLCTFACAEALLNDIDVAQNLWSRCRADIYRGFGGMFARWLMAEEVQPPYKSFGNGSAMRVSAAGFMAKSEAECIDLATRTALPTHDHPEGVKGAVATALAQKYEVELVFTLDKPGVLLDVNDDNSLIPTITPSLYAELREQEKIHSGMIPKIDNAYKTIEAGVASVRITSPDNLTGGTVVVK